MRSLERVVGSLIRTVSGGQPYTPAPGVVVIEGLIRGQHVVWHPEELGKRERQLTYSTEVLYPPVFRTFSSPWASVPKSSQDACGPARKQRRPKENTRSAVPRVEGVHWGHALVSGEEDTDHDHKDVQ